MDSSVEAYRVAMATLVLTSMLWGPLPATAQTFPEHGGRVFGLVGGSFGDGSTSLLTGGGAGLRVTRNLGIDFEVFHVNNLDLSDEDFFIARPLPLIFPPPSIRDEGNVTAFLTKLTADFPVAGDRLIPFVSGGGGVGRIHRQISVDFPDRRRPGVPAVNEILNDLFAPFPQRFEHSETGLALTLGGGLDVRLWQGLAVGAEVRWMRVLASQNTFDFAHIASRVSYRF